MQTNTTFRNGQLVATRSAATVAALNAGQEVDTTNYGLIGRVTEVNGDDVTFKSANESVHTVKVTDLIAAVHYDVSKPFSGSVGERAEVVTVDHPILGSDSVITSEIAYITEHGMFETRNTLYMPSAMDPLGFGVPEFMLTSPYLNGMA